MIYEAICRSEDGSFSSWDSWEEMERTCDSTGVWPYASIEDEIKELDTQDWGIKINKRIFDNCVVYLGEGDSLVFLVTRCAVEDTRKHWDRYIYN